MTPDQIFVHVNSPLGCEHDFKGWREFDDHLGGETVCTKCGIGAMAWSMRQADYWEEHDDKALIADENAGQIVPGKSVE